MFVAEPWSRTLGASGAVRTLTGVADPLIKLINSGQVTRRRYGRQVNSNVGLESGWLARHYPTRIRAITQDYTESAAGTRVLLYAATIINALSPLSARTLPRNGGLVFASPRTVMHIFSHER